MSVAIPFLAFLFAGAFAAYHRLRLWLWAALTLLLLTVCWFLGADPTATLAAAVIVALIAIPLLLPFLRKPMITAPLLKFYTRLLPPLSDTERTALESGTVGFEGELFSGKPDWDKLLTLPKPQLTAEEQAYLDGPCEELCRMVDDWDITHVRADLPPELWDYVKRNKFFGLNIPKEYGGLGFSALMNHKVIQKLASISTVVSSTVGVPNSLGPAELLMHYGTEDQKRHYLPRLADGREVPCFALTGPFAGSDATSIPDYGIVCKGVWNGEETLGFRLTLNKRYITLAPVATLIGVAFRMYDPDGLIGDKRDIGISLALVPRDVPGLDIGRRHFPLNSPFQNGPIRGKDIFIPLSQLIGGREKAGHGWQMLMECLSIGRSITLPSTASGGSKIGAVVVGAYARIRKQFGLSVGRFEGVEEALARIAGKAYAISALSQATAAAVARGENPAVPSTIAKYHCTQMGREVAVDMMDILGGKGIILGPRNFAGRAWQASPIAITVEGANILTRSMIIFGQGALRAHPYVLREIDAVAERDERRALHAFDAALFGHLGFFVSNAARALWMGLTGARFVRAPGAAPTAAYYRQLTRFASAFACAADMALFVLGGELKRRERLSARLGDILSQLYLASCALKRFEDDGRPAEDLPLLDWSLQDALARMQEAFYGLFDNLPGRFSSAFIRFCAFPWGRTLAAPSDALGHAVCRLVLAPGAARDRLTAGIFIGSEGGGPVAVLEAAFSAAIEAEPIEQKIRAARKAGSFAPASSSHDLEIAAALGVISKAEAQVVERARALRRRAIMVDDFPRDLRRSEIYQSTQPVI